MYEGQIVPIPLGNFGLNTDDPSNKVPSSALIRALNVQYLYGLVEKEPGAIRYNANVLPAGVSGLYDWWPNDVTQRMIAVCSNGRVYRFTNGFINFSEVTPSDLSPAALTVDNQVFLITGGSEASNSPRKLFIFSRSEPQVIVGDATKRRALTAPAADWTPSNFPFAGVVHHGRLWVWGNANRPHAIYASSATDHEDFSSLNSLVNTVYSGDGEKIIAAISYKGALFVVKYPYGLYQLIDTDPSAANWYFTKIQEEVGAASPHALDAVINDFFVLNSNSTVSSLTAVLAFGNLRAGEILYSLRNERFVREETAQEASGNKHALYYSDKKRFMGTYRSSSSQVNNRILEIDMIDQSVAKVSWSDKDQPNCMTEMKDYLGVKRPIYGSNDGYIYIMDRADRSVAGNAYAMDFQTPYLDFGFLDPKIADLTKQFDFLEVEYEPCGDWDLNVDVYVDARYIKTLAFNMSGNSSLGTFKLGQTKLGIRSNRQSRRAINAFGRRISFHCTNAVAGQNCKIARLVVYLNANGEQAGGSEE